MKHKLFTCFTTLLITLGTSHFFANTTFAENQVFGTIDDYTGLNVEKQQKAYEIIQQLKLNLSKLGITVPPPENFSNLDENTKEKVKEILQSLREGKITKEEARAKLKELGITLPKHDNQKNVSEKTKEQAQFLVEDARSQLEQLGVNLPINFEKIIKETRY